MKVLKLIFKKCLLCLFLAGFTFQCHASEIYVSPDGHTKADGSLKKPYCSLPDAVTAARDLRQSGYTYPITVVLREGRHQLNQTLVLGLDDGTPVPLKAVTLPKYGAGQTSGPACLTFATYPGEHPVISAGVPVNSEIDTPIIYADYYYLEALLRRKGLNR